MVNLSKILPDRPRPLMNRAGVVSTVSTLVALLVGFGLIPATMADDISDKADVIITILFSVLTLVGPLVHAKISEPVVTPVADPMDNQGNALVPAGTENASVDAAYAFEVADSIHPFNAHIERRPKPTPSN